MCTRTRTTSIIAGESFGSKMVIDLVSDSDNALGGGGGATQDESALEMLVAMGFVREEASMALSQVWEETVQSARAH